MSPSLVWAIVGLFLMLLFLVIGMPIGITMLMGAFIGTIGISGIDRAFSIIQIIPFSAISNYILVTLPLFILMGEFASVGGLSEDGYYFMNKLFGPLPGGLPMATVGGCAAFAAVCGSSLATAATMSKVALPEMIRYKTDQSLATGVIAAGGTLGILIPPSIGFIIYAIIAQESIGKLFLAGFLPGILLSFLFMTTLYLLVLFNPSLSPAASRASFKVLLVAAGRAWGILGLFLLIIGGIYAGIFTPNEGAGIGASGTLLLALCKRRLTLQGFWTALSSATRTTGMIFIIIVGAVVFGHFLALAELPGKVSTFVAGLQASRWTILALVLLFYMGLGCVMDIMAGMLVTLPVIFPLIAGLGFNHIWFGVLLVVVMEMGMITPPVGLNVFAISGMSNVPIQTVFRGVLPFIGAMIVCLIILILFPKISLFLPNLMG